jgi:hypothetical protein
MGLASRVCALAALHQLLHTHASRRQWRLAGGCQQNRSTCVCVWQSECGRARRSVRGVGGWERVRHAGRWHLGDPWGVTAYTSAQQKMVAVVLLCGRACSGGREAACPASSCCPLCCMHTAELWQSAFGISRQQHALHVPSRHTSYLPAECPLPHAASHNAVLNSCIPMLFLTHAAAGCLLACLLLLQMVRRRCQQPAGAPHQRRRRRCCWALCPWRQKATALPY